MLTSKLKWHSVHCVQQDKHSFNPATILFRCNNMANCGHISTLLLVPDYYQLKRNIRRNYYISCSDHMQFKHSQVRTLQYTNIGEYLTFSYRNYDLTRKFSMILSF